MHCGSKGKAAIGENAPHAALQILHHILVLHAQDAPRGQRLVPVPHQLKICAVVTRDVLDAVGEFLPLGKKLFQIAETAGDWLTPCIDDTGVRAASGE